MKIDQFDTSIEDRFEEYVEHLSGSLGHSDRVGPFRSYCMGLLLPGGRKSVEPMAARVSPDRVSATHQSLHHFVAKAEWSDEAMLDAVASYVMPMLQLQEPVKAWIVDDTGFPKKGKHSVGVARQYCGQTGKQDNCQVAVSISLANHFGSLPVAYRLYLHEQWAKDASRKEQAGVPGDVGFQTKPRIALDQLRAMKEKDFPQGAVVADAGYGNESDFRAGLRDLELSYVVGIQKNTKAWIKGEGPLSPPVPQRTGRPPKLLRPDPNHPPIQVLEVARKLSDFEVVTWREGTNEELSGRFARVRVREAHRFYWKDTLPDEEWLLIEWPQGEEEPTKYWLSNLPEDVSMRELVDLAKLRWRIERDYQELKQEIGLGHFEGRGWRGFHHHAALCIAAYGFLVAERSAFPPSAHQRKPMFKKTRLPEGFRPRGSTDQSRKTHPLFHQNHTETARGGSNPNS